MSFLNKFSVLREGEGGGGGGGGGDTGAAAAAAAAAAANGGQQQQQAPVPYYKGLYGDDGKIDKTALDRLPDHLKGHKDYFAKYETIDALLHAGVTAHTLGVKKGLAPLRGDEPPEVLNERGQLLDTVNNVPKEWKDYGLTREKIAKDLPEQYWDQKLADSFAELGKKHHISPAAMTDIVNLQLGSTNAQLAAGKAQEEAYYTQQGKDFEAAMQKAGIPIDEANALVARAAATAGVDPKSPILKNAAAMQMAVTFARLVSESKLKNGEGGGDNKSDPIEQARDIARNPQNPEYKAYHDSTHPDHERVIGKWNELYRTAKPR